ncbi:hypothetical protein DL93DRAFT_2224720 [Clavulina sp. PMI_390]|nr:hypothetical protein DL93DRAFT_2224720 [Clavulina sp. PMI_390]
MFRLVEFNDGIPNRNSYRNVSKWKNRTVYYSGGNNIIGSATPGPIHDLLKGRMWDTLGELGKSVVELQLSLYAESLREVEAQRTSSAHLSLVEHALTAIGESLTGNEDDIAAISSIPVQLARKLVWNSIITPYSMFRILQRQLHGGDDWSSGELAPHSFDFTDQDIDEWILANERALREDRRKDWKIGLVDYAAHADSVFHPSPKSTTAARVIQRETLSGYTILDDLRPPEIRIQPSFASFQAMFKKITDSLLNGLDWSNVFVAGGIVLSTLLCTTERDLQNSIQSDIDMYIYGLDPIAANKKVQHIFEVWKSNLPESSRDKTLVVRNSRTITFFSEYPIKRIQIVLKLVKNPKAVLLNFDLDICAMGYDGTSLVMLPRAARALETGYNVFTMDLVHGHYLGERRASQQSRVFKYADKGFGLRFLPSYVDSLADSFACGPAFDHHRGRFHGSATHSPDLDEIAVRAGVWTKLAIEKCRDNEYWNNSQRNPGSPMECTYADLQPDGRNSVKSEPGEHSCLTSYELLMRHTELWREKVKGHIKMTRMLWAADNYDTSATGYDDSPEYEWGKDFKFETFRQVLETYNSKDYRSFCAYHQEIMRPHHESRLQSSGNTKLEECGRTRRVTIAPDVSTLLEQQGDMVLLFFASSGFAAFANELVEDALKERGLSLSREGRMIEVLGQFTRHYSRWKKFDVEMLRWRIDSVIGWQQIDRRIDEVFEILWSFYRTFGHVRMSPDDLEHKFFTEVGRRTIRSTPSDEHAAFAKWVLKGVPRTGENIFNSSGSLIDEEDLKEDEEDESDWFG